MSEIEFKKDCKGVVGLIEELDDEAGQQAAYILLGNITEIKIIVGEDSQSSFTNFKDVFDDC